jgi:hypothetical protein
LGTGDDGSANASHTHLEIALVLLARQFAFAQHQAQAALLASPGKEAEQRINSLLQKAFAEDAMDLIAAALIAKHALIRRVRLDDIYSLYFNNFSSFHLAKAYGQGSTRHYF